MVVLMLVATVAFHLASAGPIGEQKDFRGPYHVKTTEGQRKMSGSSGVEATCDDPCKSVCKNIGLCYGTLPPCCNYLHSVFTILDKCTTDSSGMNCYCKSCPGG